MHNGDQETPLMTFVKNALGEEPKPEPEGVQREAARQEAIKARVELVKVWRDYANAPERLPVETLNGVPLVQLREACGLDIGLVSEIAGVSPSTIEAAESGKQTFADDELRRLAGAMRDALLESGDAA